MTDYDPATLSSDLLARKGSAGAVGFAPMALDPNERQGRRFGWVGAWSDRSLRRGLSSSAVVAIAIAVGAAASWVSAPTRHPASDAPAVVAQSTPNDASWSRVGAEPEVPAWRSNHLLAAAGEPDGQFGVSGAPEPAQTAPLLESPVAVSLTPDPPLAVPGKPMTVEPLASTVPPDKVPAAAPNGRAPTKPSMQAAAPGYRVQLHTLASRTAVDREWLRLRRRHADLLADKRLVIDRLDGSGGAAKYRLQLGHLANRSAAQQLCRALTERGQKCFVVPTS